MATNDTKTKRAANYTEDEKVYILEQIRDRKHIIETRRKDYKSNLKKVDMWKEITVNFNEEFPTRPRTTDQLKMFWNRAKVSATKESAAARKSLRKTGGGPSDAPQLSAGSSIAMEIIGDAADPLPNAFDSDATVDHVLPQQLQQPVSKMNKPEQTESNINAPGKKLKIVNICHLIRLHCGHFQ